MNPENKRQAIAIMKVENGYITIPMNMDERANFQPVEINRIRVFTDFGELVKYMGEVLK